MKKILIFMITIVMTITLSGAALAADQETLTYRKAVDMALANSKTYKNAEADTKRAYEIRQDTSDDVKITPLEPGDTGVVSTFLGSVKADLSWRTSVKTYEITRDSIEYQVKQAYNSVLLAEKKKKVADLTAENSYWQNRLAELKYQNGMASLMERMQANSGYSGAKESQEAAAKALSDAYQKFNALVGLSSGARPKLTDEPKFEQMGKVDLEQRVSQVTSDSYSVWLADQKVEMAKLDLDMYMSRTASEPYAAKKIDLNKAENSAVDARTNLAKQIRTLYYSIRQLEDTYTSLLASLNTAEQGYKITQVKYDIGMATKAEVVTSQLELEKLRQQMLETAIQHDNNKMLFEKPWVSS